MYILVDSKAVVLFLQTDKTTVFLHFLIDEISCLVEMLGSVMSHSFETSSDKFVLPFTKDGTTTVVERAFQTLFEINISSTIGVHRF